MIIGIDISSLPYGTGVSNYTLNLVRHLIKIDKNNQYKLFFSSLRQPLPEDIKKLEDHANVNIFHYRLPPTLLNYLWNRLHIVNIESFIGPCDIFHTWDWTEPPSKNALKVTTIHDFVPFLYPDTQHPKTISTFKQKLYFASRECAHFICVSQNTKKDLHRLFPDIPESKISVVYEAAEDKYDEFDKLNPSQKNEKMLVISKQYGLNKYILAQGTREPRKNLDRLIRAFNNFKKKHPTSKVELAITGKYGWGKDISPPTDNSVKILGYIPEKDLVALHAAAMCLAYPSLYEGFGLPIVKSMKVGTPVITSSVSSLPEVAGKAAILVNPTSVSDIESAITRIVSDSRLRNRLSAEGKKHSSLFSWHKTAVATLNIYEELLRSKR